QSPVITHIFTGSGLDRAPERGTQGTVQAEGQHTGLTVRQHITHNPTGSRVHDGTKRGHGLIHTHVYRLSLAQISQSTVRVGQLQQGDISTAQGQAVTIK